MITETETEWPLDQNTINFFKWYKHFLLEKRKKIIAVTEPAKRFEKCILYLTVMVLLFLFLFVMTI